MKTTTRKNGRAPTLRDSVEQVWLAGLGALAMTEQEGTKLFRTLVKRGEGFEKGAKVRIKKAVTAAKEAPGATIDRIEAGIDDTMTGVLRRLGVPTKREITSLTRRVEGLATTLERKPAPRRRAPSRRRKAAAAGVTATTE